MTAREMLDTITNPTMVRIVKNGQDLYTGYKGSMTERFEAMPEWAQEEVEKFAAVPEIRHKRWKQMGLMPPLHPEETPQYSFSDLQMTIYYTITLKGKHSDRIKELESEIEEHEKHCIKCRDRGNFEVCACCDVHGNISDFERELEYLRA